MPSGRILVGLENPNALTIAYTDDVGTTWTTVVVDPNALFKFAKERLFWWVTDSTLLFANSERVYRSTNGGVSWTAVLSDPQRFPDCLFVDYASPGPVVYCAASHQLAQVPYRMYRSSDAGATWVAVDEVAGKSGDNADSVRSRIVRTDTGVLLLIGGVLINGVRRQSFDDGFTWSPYTPPQNVWANVYRTKGALISYDPETGGVMRSTDHGASWTFTGLNIGANLSIPVFASAFGTLPLAGSGLRRGRLGIIGAPRLRRGLGGTPSSVIGPSSSPQSSPLSQPSEPLPQPSEPSPPSQPSSPQPPSRRPKKPKPQEPQTPR